ncbi:MAG: helix-turn-helix domain-containing protein [Desulfobacteraceae bacterium]|nr:MAG: helix-turn-helix domain-containing protein [Desulfobacteraceae bacterium]
MLPGKNSFSFGRYLQTFRIESGKSMEDVSKETKIGIQYLTAIENEQLDRLPQEVFVKGFLRSYSRAVNADGNEAVRRYLACTGALGNTAKPENELKKTDFRFWKRIFMLSGIFLFIIIISVSSVSFIYEPESGKRTDRAGKTDKLASLVKESGNTDKGLEDKAKIEHTDSGKIGEELSLEISAVKDTWMKVIIDGQNPREYLLNSGDLLELKASKGYNLLVGDAGAIRLNINGRPLEIPRESGRAANIQIP